MNNMTIGHAYTVCSSASSNPKTAENILESDRSKFIKFYRLWQFWSKSNNHYNTTNYTGFSTHHESNSVHIHKVRHPCCVYNKQDWSLYTCLTQLYGGIDMYNLLHKEQLHVSALNIGHLQVEKWETLVSSYTRLEWVVYSGEVRGGVGTRSRMCCVGCVVRVHGFCYILF